MRLIGGHDYYDGAGMGVDTGVVFVRDNARHLADLPVITDHPFRAPDPTSYGDNRDGVHLIPLLVMVGGHRTPALEERVTRSWVTASRFIYDPKEAEEALLRARERHRSHLRLWRGRSFLQELRAFFEADIRPEETAWLIDHHVTVLTTWRPASWDRLKKDVPAQINHACLKELELYRDLDPNTAHMRISSFVSGVLPFERETVKIGDRDRIRKAGFDLKTSFRRPKGHKKHSRQG